MTSTIKNKIVGAVMAFCVGGIVITNVVDYKKEKEYLNTINSTEHELKTLKKEVSELNIQNEELKSDISDQNKMILKRDDDLKNKHNRIVLLKGTKNERIEYLKRELKKKPKVVYKTEYKEKIVYKESQKKQAQQVTQQVSLKPVEKKQKTIEKVSNETGELPTQSKPVGGASFQMTSYTADCSGCSGITATGVDVKSTTTVGGMRVIAVDPSIIPLGSVVRVTTASGSFTAKALDTGGAIKGNIIDLLVGSASEAQANGRQQVKVEILK